MERGSLDYFATPITRVVRSRIGWLLLLFVAETLTGTVLRQFEDELAKVVGTGKSLALVVGLTILAVCAWANVVAAVVPLAAQRLKIDPTVISAPLITTLVDATGLAIYMLIAKAVLGL